VKDVMGSPEQVNKRMEGAIDIYDNVIESRLNDPKTGARVTIMQRLHENDIPGYLLGKYAPDGPSNRQGFDHVVLPTQYDPEHPHANREDPRKRPGELLNPDRYDDEWVSERANDPKRAKAWASQHQQRPTPQQGTKFLSHWFNHRYSVPPWVIVHQMDDVVISVDAAEKKGKKNDFSALQVWGKMGSKLYLLDRICEQMEINELLSAFLTLCKKWPTARVKLIEDKSNGTALIQLAKNIHGILGVVAVNPGAIGDKQTRAKFSQVRYEAGDVLLPANNDAHWLGGFIDQHLSFPNGSNDDEIDAESQAVYYFEAGEDPTEEYDRLLNAFGG